MSREKQIEEITKLINTPCNDRPHDNCYEYGCLKCQAGLIYNAGYRKQSEGEWKGNGYLKHCSECGNVVNFNNVSRWLYNFCPNCGTKMKGEAKK